MEARDLVSQNSNFRKRSEVTDTRRIFMKSKDLSSKCEQPSLQKVRPRCCHHVRMVVSEMAVNSMNLCSSWRLVIIAPRMSEEVYAPRRTAKECVVPPRAIHDGLACQARRLIYGSAFFTHDSSDR